MTEEISERLHSIEDQIQGLTNMLAQIVGTTVTGNAGEYARARGLSRSTLYGWKKQHWFKNCLGEDGKIIFSKLDHIRLELGK